MAANGMTGSNRPMFAGAMRSYIVDCVCPTWLSIASSALEGAAK